MAARRLAPLADLTERASERMRETALAYLDHQGNSVAMARALHLHPQTVRYRVNRLRELLGEQLDDPGARFELEVALRSQPPASGGGSRGRVRKTASQSGEETPNPKRWSWKWWRMCCSRSFLPSCDFGTKWWT